MRNVSIPAALSVLLTLYVPARTSATTLEKLTVEQMSQKATLIVRGRVSSCSGEMQGSIIFTRCLVSVTERWKGQSGNTISFVIPGGSARGLIQTFTGTPKFTDGGEYVLFLWAGRSGTNQIIGLTQGAFDLKTDSKGQVMATRSASAEQMLDSTGRPVQDESIEIQAGELKERVKRVLPGAGAKQ